MKKMAMIALCAMLAGLGGFIAGAYADVEAGAGDGFVIKLGGSIDMAVIPFQLIINDDAGPQFFGAPEQEEMIIGAGAGRYGSSQGPRARLDLKAHTTDENETIGMRMRIQARTEGIGIEDYLQAWWKPTEWLRFDLGRFFNDKLRGKVNDLDERFNGNNVRMYDGDAIFSRFRTHRYGGQAGFMVSVEAAELFWLGVMMYDLSPFAASSSSLTSAALFEAHPEYVTDNKDAFHRIQAGFEYQVFPQHLLLRAQYLGAKPMVEIRRVSDEILDDNNNLFFTYSFDTFNIIGPRVEVATAFLNLEKLGLLFDVGGKIPLPFKDWDRGPVNIFEKDDEELYDPIYRSYKDGFIWQAPYQVSFGVIYKNPSFQMLELAGRFDAKFLGYVKGSKDEIYFPTEINWHVWPSWNVINPYTEEQLLKVILDFGMEYIGPTYNKAQQFVGEGTVRALNGGYRYGAGISVQKNFLANCFVKAGVAYKFAGTVNSVNEKAVLSIPLHLEYNF